jgi:hypothetical protein
MAQTKRTWITVVVAVLIMLAICGIAVVGGIAYIVSSHYHSEVLDAQPASLRFAEARQRFGGQQPLVQIRGPHDAVLREDIRARRGRAAAKLHSIRALVYDPSENRLVDVTLPFWLLRMAPESSDWSFMSENGVALDSRHINLSAADLERFGPSLVLDLTDPRGHQVLVWTE